MSGLLRLGLFLLSCTSLCGAGRLRLAPHNPHYLEYNGRPVVLVTSGEHYGAVINRAFDYKRYLAELQAKHLNLTRTWVGPYHEVPGNFNIANNTLAPKPEDFIAPWPRSSTPGARDGLNKFDLAAWNPAFFTRLKDFLREADARGVIVEVNLFCPYYRDDMWDASPLNAANNINEVGRVPRTDALALKEEALTRVQDALVRKLADELRGFGNLYFEICNEPYFGGVTAEWQHHIAQVVHDAEPERTRHLISMNIANGSAKVASPDPLVSILNFHYSRPPLAIDMNAELNLPVGMNETGFDGNSDAVYRIQGWDFLMAGGALYNNLDYSFTVGREDGSATYPAATPGGGSAALRAQLGILREWLESLDLIRMGPDLRVLSAAKFKDVSGRALSDARNRFAIYLHQGRVDPAPRPHYVVDGGTRRASFALVLPPGAYRLSWIDPKTGQTIRSNTLQAEVDPREIQSPEYVEDILLDIRRR